MLVSVALQIADDGAFRMTAPDLPGCVLADTDRARAFARIRLAIEGYLTERLLAGEALPAVGTAADWRKDPRYGDAQWFEAHINVAHLQAVARHQHGRPAPA